jgi:hypothetical protein
MDSAEYAGNRFALQTHIGRAEAAKLFAENVALS